MTDIQDDALVEDRLNKGILNAWHPVLPSYGVRDAPIGITRLSENIVLWRDQEGKVHAAEDRCPHRGARLSLGWNLGGRIACWYHGVEIESDGTVAEVPAADDCNWVGKKLVRIYPVEERAGAIFLYFGDPAHMDPPAIDLPDELTSDEFSHFLCTAHWKSNYRYAIDNVMDPMHGAYLHAVSHSMASGDRSAQMRARKTDTGLIFEKTEQAGVNFDWVEFSDTGSLWMRLSIPYQKKFGPGGHFWIIGFATPVDEHNTEVFFWRVRRVSGWQRDAWRFLYRTKLEQLHWNVLEQDRIMLEDMAPDARHNENLYSHDIGLSQIRRILKTKAAEQVAAFAAAEAAE